MLQSYELSIGGIPGRNTSYVLGIDLCQEAVLVSVETKPNDALAGAIDMTFNFSIPEEAQAHWNKGSRGFEVWSVAELEQCFYPNHVLVASVGEGLFVFENRNFELELEEETPALDQYDELLEQVGEAGPFAPSGRSLTIYSQKPVCLHLKDDPFKTVVYIEMENHPQSGRPSLNIKFEHAALANECGAGFIYELGDLVGKSGEVVHVPDNTNRPIFRYTKIDVENAILEFELDENVDQKD